MFRHVKLGKQISVEDLIGILVDSAEELGLKVGVEDSYRTEYILGSVREEQVYTGTEIRLRGRVLPMGGISLGQFLHGKDLEVRQFSIGTGLEPPPYFGFGSKELIEEYLAAVSKRVEAH